MTLTLLVNGARVAPCAAQKGLLTFRVGLPAREIRLVSGYARPSDISDSMDDRRLGVALRGVRWSNGDNAIETPIASPAFMDGFHAFEVHEQEGLFRWTNGNAALPPPLFPPWRGEVLLHLDLSFWDGSDMRPPPSTRTALLSIFENLGENCELSLVQRHYGVEFPLTLLSWAGTSPARLIRGLETRFEGLGDPTTTEIIWNEGDYRLRTPYLNFHTNIITERDETGLAEIGSLGCASLRLLRRKLLHDIATTGRIFVFSSADPAFGEAAMRRMHDALRGIGPASLLCVSMKPPEGAGRTGDATIDQWGEDRQPVRLADGLYAGWLDRSVVTDANDKARACEGWLTLCSQVVALHYAG